MGLGSGLGLGSNIPEKEEEKGDSDDMMGRIGLGWFVSFRFVLAWIDAVILRAIRYIPDSVR